MSDQDYVIQIEGQSSKDAKISETVGAVKISSSRRTSTSSQQSLPSCTSPNYDSGNFSYSNTSDISIPPIGDSSAEDESSDYLPEFNLSELTDDVKQLQKDLREKDQMLLLAVADARKMKSELERLVKSERWYKNELRDQKRSKLELLEKLYLNERKFVEENQKLKADCANLYSVCSEIERKALSEKDTLVRQLQELQRLFESTKVVEGRSPSQSVIDQLKFELQKQRESVVEKETLIELLKKQKQSLLKDLDKLTSERDTKILNLEANALSLEQENRKITKKCVTLIEEKKSLEEDLRKHEKLLEDTKSILQQRDLDITHLREKQQDHLKELQARASEIEGLKALISNLEAKKLQEGSNNLENLKLLENYRKEIERKSAEIEELKSLRRGENDKMSKLQVEVLSLENLRESYECTRREIEQLKFQLQSKEFEIENLRIFQTNQNNQIAGLQEKLLEYQRLRENFDKYVNLLQANNEILEAREHEIERLKLANENILKNMDEIKTVSEQREKLLEEKEGELCDKQKEIDELEFKFKEQSRKVEELCIQIEETEKLRENLISCQNLLQASTEDLTLKEKEIINLKEFIGTQSEKLLELDTVVQENSKLCKNIENLNKEFAQRSAELDHLKAINSKQAAEISNLNKCKEQLGQVQKVVEEKTSELRNRDLEIETLRLVLKGQKAQIKRFHCKCVENEELREKFEEATNLLKIDKNIFETEAAELEYLRKIAQRQAMEIYKLTEEKDGKDEISDTVSNDESLSEKLLELEKYLGNNELHETYDLEAKVHKIEMMKALLDKKSDKISQLNCETERWIELLRNLRISKSKSRKSSLERSSRSPSLKLPGVEESRLEKLNLEITRKSKGDQSQVNDKNTSQKSGSSVETDDTPKNDDGPNLNKISVHENESENISNIFSKNNDELHTHTCIKQVPVELSHIENDENLKVDNEELKEIVIDSSNSSSNSSSRSANCESPSPNRKSEVEDIEHPQTSENHTEYEVGLVESKPELQQQEPESTSAITLSLQNLLENYKTQVILHPPNDILEDANTDAIKSQRNLRITSIKVPDPYDANNKQEDIDWKVLKKVIESEHRKKIARYEVHMRTLLDNIKSYKKKLEVMEGRYEKLLEKYKTLEELLKESEREKEMLKMSYETEIENIMTTKVKEIQEFSNKTSRESLVSAQKLDEVSKKYEKSQRIIAVLKYQLETARKQFLEMDDYKRLSVDLKLNLNNFVDDYKKLLTPLNSYKCSIAVDEIYDLINRSNNLVPNFDNLSNSIDALKTDIKKFSTCAVGRFSPVRKMSLLDELKAADPSRYS